MYNDELIRKLREQIPKMIAEELASVQPMSNIDFDALAESPLWQSYCNRHFNNPSDGGDLVSTGVDSRDGNTVGDDRKSSKNNNC